MLLQAHAGMLDSLSAGRGFEPHRPTSTNRAGRQPDLDLPGPPGAASEVTAARHGHLAARLRAAGLGALADLGFTGQPIQVGTTSFIGVTTALPPQSPTPGPPLAGPGMPENRAMHRLV
jgi:hypothetical protein